MLREVAGGGGDLLVLLEAIMLYITCVHTDSFSLSHTHTLAYTLSLTHQHTPTHVHTHTHTQFVR